MWSQAAEVAIPDQKLCKRCDLPKAIDEFYNNRRAPDGKQAWCKACNKAASAAYRQTDAGKMANRRGMANWRAKKAGVPAERIKSFEKMFFNQRGRCAYCSEPLDDNFELDHVVPIAKGGGNTPRNVVLACIPCNRKKRANLWIPNVDINHADIQSQTELIVEDETHEPEPAPKLQKRVRHLSTRECDKCRTQRPERHFYDMHDRRCIECQREAAGLARALPPLK